MTTGRRRPRAATVRGVSVWEQPGGKVGGSSPPLTGTVGGAGAQGPAEEGSLPDEAPAAHPAPGKSATTLRPAAKTDETETALPSGEQQRHSQSSGAVPGAPGLVQSALKRGARRTDPGQTGGRCGLLLACTVALARTLT